MQCSAGSLMPPAEFPETGEMWITLTSETARSGRASQTMGSTRHWGSPVERVQASSTVTRQAQVQVQVSLGRLRCRCHRCNQHFVNLDALKLSAGTKVFHIQVKV